METEKGFAREGIREVVSRLVVRQSSTNPRATLTDSKTQHNTGKRLASSIYHPTVIIQLIISKSLNPTF